MAYSIGFDIFARDRASKEFDQVGASIDRAGGKLGKLKTLAVAGAAVVGAAVVKTGMAVVDLASDQGESLNKSSVIFGKNAAAIEKWASGAWKSAGLSKTAALEAASGFGDMFLQLGFAQNKATNMSKSVVQLSADLGSFNNLPTAEVSEMISAAFRGEYDSLQRLIPNINAARVEKEALAATGKKNVKELTAQEKAAATLAIVQKDGARAAGDFGRTQSTSWANIKKTGVAALQNIGASAGKVLLPALLKLGNWFIADGLPAVQKFGGWLSGTLWPALKLGYQTIMPGLQNALSIVKGGVDGNGISWRKVSDVITGKVIPFLAVLARSYLPVLATNIRIGIEAVKGLWKAFEFWRTVVGKVIGFVLGAFATVTRVWAGVLDALGHVPGFGWAREAASKMRGAASAADAIRNRINAIPSTKRVNVMVSATAMTGRITVAGQRVNIGQFAAGGRPPVGRLGLFGERGAEFWVPDEPGTVIDAETTKAMMAGGRRSGPAPVAGMFGSPIGGGVVYIDNRRTEITLPGVTDRAGAGRELAKILRDHEAASGAPIGLAGQPTGAYSR